MPIRIDKLKKYEKYEKDEIEISRFLGSRKGEAFTCLEIYEALKGFTPLEPKEEGSRWTWKNVGLFTLDMLAFGRFCYKLSKMVENGKITMKIAESKEYYYIEDITDLN